MTLILSYIAYVWVYLYCAKFWKESFRAAFAAAECNYGQEFAHQRGTEIVGLLLMQEAVVLEGSLLGVREPSVWEGLTIFHKTHRSVLCLYQAGWEKERVVKRLAKLQKEAGFPQEGGQQ